MIRIVENPKEILKLLKKLDATIKSSKPEYIKTLVGFQGGAIPLKVAYFEEYDFWTGSQDDVAKDWNAFGIGRPIVGKNTNITCEINFPYDGIDRRTAGAFGIENDQFVILHRGRIGGGRKNIGKSLFFENYRGKFITVMDGDIESNLALVGHLNSLSLLEQLSLFVHEVHRIKNFEDEVLESISLARVSEPETSNYEYREEGFGKKHYTRQDEIEAECTHGIVVNALAKTLEKKGYQIANDKKRDLYTLVDNKIDILFEAKTDLTNSSIYSAIGQILLYSAERDSLNCKKVLVLPEKLNAEVERSISKLGLKILYFKHEENKVLFYEIDNILTK